MEMSQPTRREYMATMQQRYKKATTRQEKSRLLDEIQETVGYHRKYAIQLLNGPIISAAKPPSKPRKRPLKYQEAMPVIQLVWEALDYPCAERLQPVLLSTARILATHDEITLTLEIEDQLAHISCSTLARRIAKWPSPKARLLPHQRTTSKLRSEIPIERYAWDEQRTGALEIDLVEHNGGSSLGHFAYTLTVVDVVTGYSRRRAFLGRSQKVVFQALTEILSEWPSKVWGLHSDNGSEFLSAHLVRYCKANGLKFTRSRPYKKNDSPHVEQKNLQYVRQMVGYERYDTPEAVAWLNEVYACLDPYANLFLPMRKVIAKERHGSHVSKYYDTARTPFQRLLEKDALLLKARVALKQQCQTLNPLVLHKELEKLTAQGVLSINPKVDTAVSR